VFQVDYHSGSHEEDTENKAGKGEEEANYKTGVN
jgi:hypothetical protein